MNTENKIAPISIIALMMLTAWLVILFFDGFFSQQQIVNSSIVPLLSSQEQAGPINLATVDELPASEDSAFLSHSSASTDASTSNSLLPDVTPQEYSVPVTQSTQDVATLELIYQQKKSPDVLKALIAKYLQYYQFDKANQSLDLLLVQYKDYVKTGLDPHMVIYALLHNSTILIDKYNSKGMLTMDDMYFYQGLKALRFGEFVNAQNFFTKIKAPEYQSFVTAYNLALETSAGTKNAPSYYKQGLVSLMLLKHGYFVFAKRFALQALMANDNYILPYQVLAYSSFLTHNRETCTQYFLKLVDFDAKNISSYKFLIGVSYYRNGHYDEAILYLSQVNDPTLQTDVYRYLLLSYLQEEDWTNAINTRQHLLGQSGLTPSDMMKFFYEMFYSPFQHGSPYTLYFDNLQLATLYLNSCSHTFTGSDADVCIYGQVALQLPKQTLSGLGDKLLYLSDKYHQSYLFHLVGDYYAQSSQYKLAKEAYSKALTLCSDVDEQSILQAKLKRVLSE